MNEQYPHGPIPPMSLDRRAVAEAQCRDKAYKLFDGLGLSFLVKPNGARELAQEWLQPARESLP